MPAILKKFEKHSAPMAPPTFVLKWGPLGPISVGGYLNRGHGPLLQKPQTYKALQVGPSLLRQNTPMARP